LLTVALLGGCAGSKLLVKDFDTLYKPNIKRIAILPVSMKAVIEEPNEGTKTETIGEEKLSEEPKEGTETKSLGKEKNKKTDKEIAEEVKIKFRKDLFQKMVDYPKKHGEITFVDLQAIDMVVSQSNLENMNTLTFQFLGAKIPADTILKVRIDKLDVARKERKIASGLLSGLSVAAAVAAGGGAYSTFTPKATMKITIEMIDTKTGNKLWEYSPSCEIDNTLFMSIEKQEDVFVNNLIYSIFSKFPLYKK